MKVAEEIIRALYKIRDAINGNNGESGGGSEQNVDNGLMGADAAFVCIGYRKVGTIVTNFDDLVNFFNSQKENYPEYGNGIVFLYKKNNFDKLGKPTIGQFKVGETDPKIYIGPGFDQANIQYPGSVTLSANICINFVTRETLDIYEIKEYSYKSNDNNNTLINSDYYYLQEID